MVDSGTMLRRALPRFAILAALALCAAHAPVSGGDAPALVDRWKSDRVLPQAIRNVLIVGIAADEHARRAFEDRFVTMLRARGGEASTSYSIVPDLRAERDSAAVLGALFARRVEGVITVRLRPFDKKTPEPERAAAWKSAMAGPEPVRDYVAAALRDFDTKTKQFGAEVVFWSMDDEKRVWAGRFSGYSLKALRNHAPGMVQVVLDDMRFAGLY